MTDRPSLSLGHVIALGALLLTGTLLFFALADVHGWPVPESVMPWVIGISTVGLAIAGTGGAAYIGSTAVLHPEGRWVLGPLYLLMLAGLTWIITGYLVAHYKGPLVKLLGEWIWLYMGSIVAVGELAASGALVAQAVRDRRTSHVESLKVKLAASEDAREELTLAAGAREEANKAEIASLREEINALELKLAGATSRPSGPSGITYPPLILQILRDAGEWLTAEEVVSRIEEEGASLASARRALNREHSKGNVGRKKNAAGAMVYAAAPSGESLPELGEAA